MSAPRDLDTHRIAVTGVSGEHLEWVDDDGARELLKAGGYRLIRRGPRYRVLQAVAGMRNLGEVAGSGRGSGLDHKRYSHKHENEYNPPNVWCLLHLRPSDMMAA